jgi:cytochrome c oxidase cbb3-type subunit 3
VTYFGLPKDEFMMVILIILLVTAAVLVITVSMYVVSMLNIILLKDQREKGLKPDGLLTGMWRNWMNKQNFRVAIEDEADIMLDHEYDGIKELDNHLPPWWKALFYVCIVFAVIYISLYEVTGTLPNQTEEFETEMAVAAKQVEAYKKTQANNIDENNVKFVKDDATAIGGGKQLFDKNCATCHGKNAEGGIGPNLTDAYWLYGGDIKGIFKTIKYGAKNGMKSWKKDLKPDEMQNVASYILTLQGTKPANAKEPQGTKLEAKK